MPTPTRQTAASEALGGTWTLCLQLGIFGIKLGGYVWAAPSKEPVSTKPGPDSLLPLGGGISSYAHDPSRAGQSLVECLEQALRDVPKDRHAGTPLYLGATAGMRLLK